MFYNQDAFHRYCAEYSTDRNMFIPSELFNHVDNPWPSVEDNIEIHLLALAITLILNKHVPLIKITQKTAVENSIDMQYAQQSKK